MDARDLEERPTDDCDHCGREIPVGQLHCRPCQRYLEKCDQQLDHEKDNPSEDISTTE